MRKSVRRDAAGRSWHDGLMILYPGAELIIQFEGHPQDFYQLRCLPEGAGVELQRLSEEVQAVA
jgi:hypothetical protein